MLRIGTRGSDLARAQTAWVAEHLAPAGNLVETIVITTTGDRDRGATLGTGVFVKELQTALLDRRIDVAVHSLKDLPTEATPGLVLAAIPTRADPRDALVGAPLRRLPAGASVGTGSPRRAAQLRRLRPDLAVVAIRGNIPTRIGRARSGELAAVMLAAAGLERLGLAPDELLGTDLVLPAPGQGALAIEVREADAACRSSLAPLDDASTRAAVLAERAVLRELGGGCMLPVAAYGRVLDGVLLLEGSVTSADGTAQALARAEGDPARPGELGAQVAKELVDLGALDLLVGWEEGAGGGAP
jgi:hydroxymethylbilane synthase